VIEALIVCIDDKRTKGGGWVFDAASIAILGEWLQSEAIDRRWRL
jgi:hypothetical protein